MKTKSMAIVVKVKQVPLKAAKKTCSENGSKTKQFRKKMKRTIKTKKMKIVTNDDSALL